MKKSKGKGPDYPALKIRIYLMKERAKRRRLINRWKVNRANQSP